mmetsp:Transcript_8573/g.14040  ORF Transcript_8573/g.14040 Transcript_8573/m.14040 type:complete len:205 (-) Transcript_8573:111-725(-)
MLELTSVLLHVQAGNSNTTLLCLSAWCSAPNYDVDMPLLCNGQVILRDLIVFGKVWIEVLLAVKLAEWRNLTVQCQASLDSKFNHSPVENGQYAWVAETNWAYVRIWRRSVLCRAPTEGLGICTQLYVHLYTDDWLKSNGSLLFCAVLLRFCRCCTKHLYSFTITCQKSPLPTPCKLLDGKVTERSRQLTREFSRRTHATTWPS